MVAPTAISGGINTNWNLPPGQIFQIPSGTYANRLFFFAGNRLFWSDNGGGTWSNVAPTFNVVQNIRSIPSGFEFGFGWGMNANRDPVQGYGVQSANPNNQLTCGLDPEKASPSALVSKFTGSPPIYSKLRSIGSYSADNTKIRPNVLVGIAGNKLSCTSFGFALPFLKISKAFPNINETKPNFSGDIRRRARIPALTDTGTPRLVLTYDPSLTPDQVQLYSTADIYADFSTPNWTVNGASPLTGKQISATEFAVVYNDSGLKCSIVNMNNWSDISAGTLPTLPAGRSLNAITDLRISSTTDGFWVVALFGTGKTGNKPRMYATHWKRSSNSWLSWFQVDSGGNWSGSHSVAKNSMLVLEASPGTDLYVALMRSDNRVMFYKQNLPEAPSTAPTWRTSAGGHPNNATLVLAWSGPSQTRYKLKRTIGSTVRYWNGSSWSSSDSSVNSASRTVTLPSNWDGSQTGQVQFEVAIGNRVGFSPFSTPLVFTPIVPLTFTVTSPSNGARFTTTKPVLRWSISSGANRVARWEVSLKWSTEQSVFHSEELPASTRQWTVGPIPRDTVGSERLQIRIRAQDTNGIWSAMGVRSVQIQTPAAQKPTNLSVSKIDNESNVVTEKAYGLRISARAGETPVVPTVNNVHIEKRIVGTTNAWMPTLEPVITDRGSYRTIVLDDWFVRAQHDYEYRVGVANIVGAITWTTWQD